MPSICNAENYEHKNIPKVIKPSLKPLMDCFLFFFFGLVRFGFGDTSGSAQG